MWGDNCTPKNGSDSPAKGYHDLPLTMGDKTQKVWGNVYTMTLLLWSGVTSASLWLKLRTSSPDLVNVVTVYETHLSFIKTFKTPFNLVASNIAYWLLYAFRPTAIWKLQHIVRQVCPSSLGCGERTLCLLDKSFKSENSTFENTRTHYIQWKGWKSKDCPKEVPERTVFQNIWDIGR